MKGFFDKHACASAVFSPDRKYRYELWRRWKLGDGGYCCFIGLNPSTANEDTDDPTIRRCVGFAKAWGYDALCMLNLFAIRTKDPKIMKRDPEPIGKGNDDTLARLTKGAGVVIAAWGVDGGHLGRANEVIGNLPPLHCLKLTKGGHPNHPLYLPKNSKPIRIPFTNESN